MNLKDFATELASENSFIKASFGGFAGSGKTRTAAEFIIGFYKKTKLQKPLLIIDNEKGSRFLVPMFENIGVKTYVKETTTLGDILEAFKMLNNGEIGFLFIDSLTKVWYKYVSDYKAQINKKFMTLQDWGKILPAWQEQFADVFVQLTGNCIFTGRGGNTYEMEENEETKKKEFVKSGVKMKMAGETPFEPDLNIWMNLCQEIDENGKPKVWREALIMKDRSGLIDGKTFKNPIFKNFEPVIDYLLNVKKGEVAKTSDNSNLAPKENYNNNKEKKDIILEKIKAEFDKRQFGTSKEEKSLKLLIVEKCFQTNSWTEVEGFDVKKLELGLDRVIEIFSSYDGSTDKVKSINEHTFSLLLQ